eukprot:TRINITY_DN9695_c1_g1_i1.p5 TRINITY_DN9695_c1_g1~~TRINITY_DN9695_c1_g1_i1.p5  ORF type:complete len:103 (-),score=1.46 TRINITY_DN9695_c1_g1_i1:121-429(-)
MGGLVFGLEQQNLVLSLQFKIYLCLIFIEKFCLLNKFCVGIIIQQQQQLSINYLLCIRQEYYCRNSSRCNRCINRQIYLDCVLVEIVINQLLLLFSLQLIAS